MLKKSMLLFVLVAIVFQVAAFGACSLGWKLVHKISITTSGETKTFRSSVTNEFGTTVLTEDEFNEERQHGRTYGEDDKKVKVISIKEASKRANGGCSYAYEEPLLQGYWYSSKYDSGPGMMRYYKHRYSRTRYSLVYVKIVNDTTIRIKQYDRETTYSVTSYQVSEA